MTRPALALVYDDDKPDQHVLLATALAESKENEAGIQKALRAANRENARLKRELDDYLEQSADAETVKQILDYWRKKVDKPRARIDLTGNRAKLVRWALRKWTPREVCLMVVGLTVDPYYTKLGISDVKHMLATKGVPDEERAEHFLELGRAAIGEPA